MPKKPYFLGERFFPSKAVLLEFLQSLWEESPVGEPLNPDDAMVVSDLLALHPRAEDKIGCGVKYLYVGISPDGSNRCFYVMRLDGTSTDFGTKKCFDGDSHVAMFKSACRAAVGQQIQDFKRDFLASPKGRELVAAGELIHIDHASPTFDHLVGRFYESLGIPVREIRFNGIGDENSSSVTFQEPQLSSRFADFHRRYAALEGVTKRHNLSDSKRGVRKTQVSPDFFVYVKPAEWESLNLTI